MSAHRASNGVAYRLVGTGEPLLLLHGLLVSGRMFEPLIGHLRTRYRMLIPDLRGHGKSGMLPGPYDVATIARDLDCVLAEAGFARFVVLGYSHGGAVAQQLARRRSQDVKQLVLACTYACNASTRRELIEAHIFVGLLRIVSPGTLGRIILWASRRNAHDSSSLDPGQLEWLQAMMAENTARAMREAAKELIAFDSRPWLQDIRTRTLVIAGTEDDGVPRHHYETLLNGIPNATGRLVDGAGHTLAWTHTRELADILLSG
jgi:pimeloyl-ACP methyl ester carboxylesterase